MIGVNVVGEEPKKLKETMDKEKLNWRSMTGKGDAVRKWNPPSTPTLYVIDHKGVIRYKWVGSPGKKALDAALKKVIHAAEEDAEKAPK